MHPALPAVRAVIRAGINHVYCAVAGRPGCAVNCHRRKEQDAAAGHRRRRRRDPLGIVNQDRCLILNIREGTQN